MRLGELRKIIKEVVSDVGVITLKSRAVYGGQASEVENFVEISTALEKFISMSWNKLPSESVAKVLEAHKTAANPVLLPQDEFSFLKSYVDQLNKTAPLFYAMLTDAVEDQAAQIINVLLPKTTANLDELTAFNTKLGATLKKFNVDGEFTFAGFDRGTNWYAILAAGTLTYQYFLGCLDGAIKYLETKKAYYESKSAELNYKASLAALEKEKEFTEKGLIKYIDNLLDLELKERIKNIINDIKELNGRANAELHTQLVIATKDLVAILGDGAEFHLSLNPPSYATEQGGQLQIDYKKIHALNTAETPETKQIEPPAM
ncbi:MAG: hypothetical protein WCT10_00930 [Patescibacteria group bacterium]|jgi:hypothetical protein